MAIALMVSLAVIITIVLVGAVGYLIDRHAERHEPDERQVGEPLRLAAPRSDSERRDYEPDRIQGGRS